DRDLAARAAALGVTADHQRKHSGALRCRIAGIATGAANALRQDSRAAARIKAAEDAVLAESELNRVAIATQAAVAADLESEPNRQTPCIAAGSATAANALRDDRAAALPRWAAGRVADRDKSVVRG